MSELTEFRRAKDQFFAGDSQSPFLPEQRRDFPHLEYFPEDPSYRFVLELVEFQLVLVDRVVPLRILAYQVEQFELQRGRADQVESQRDLAEQVEEKQELLG